MAHHVIYIPGLGDHKTYGQPLALNLWRLYGLNPVYLPLSWHKQEGLEKKLDKIDEKILSIGQDEEISLVGVSAGASAALNYASMNVSIRRIVLICGKVQHPESIRAKVYESNPDFRESMKAVGSSLIKLNEQGRTNDIMSVFSESDDTVPAEDSNIKGARHLEIDAWNHSSVIALSILLHGKKLSEFIKSRSN